MGTEITFGKYKGTAVEDLTDWGYLKWLAENNDKPTEPGKKPFKIAGNIVNAAKARLSKTPQEPAAASPVSSNTGVVEKIQKELNEWRDAANNASDNDQKLILSSTADGIELALNILTYGVE